MKKPNVLKCLLFAILSWSLISCATKPPDVYMFEDLKQRLANDPVTGHLVLLPDPVCMKEIKEPECGHGVAIVSGNEIIVGEKTLFNKKPWSILKQQSIYVPSIESGAPLLTYIINSCKKMNCSDDVNKYKIKLDSFNGISGAFKNP